MDRFGGHGHTGRVEDERLVSGRGCYVDDIQLAGMLHMAVVRSPHAHADVVTIDIASALAMPGGSRREWCRCRRHRDPRR